MIRRSIDRARRFARRIRSDASGLALLEFGLILPIFMVMSLTGAELTNYIITRMRVSQIALHLADNAARIGSGTMLQAKTISETDINDLLTGAGYQAGELNLYKQGRVIISSLEPMASPNTTNRYKIAWQRCRGDKPYDSPYDNTLTNITGMGPAGRQVIAPDDGSTMFVEVYYQYTPLIKTSLSPSTEIKEIASMMVRDRRDTTQIYNVEKATKSTC